jgi:hypothetical protein
LEKAAKEIGTYFQTGNIGLNSSSETYFCVFILGDPIILKILKSYSVSVSPSNKGAPKANSAKTHPKAHISIS